MSSYSKKIINKFIILFPVFIILPVFSNFPVFISLTYIILPRSRSQRGSGARAGSRPQRGSGGRRRGSQLKRRVRRFLKKRVTVCVVQHCRAEAAVRS